MFLILDIDVSDQRKSVPHIFLCVKILKELSKNLQDGK